MGCPCRSRRYLPPSNCPGTPPSSGVMIPAAVARLLRVRAGTQRADAVYGCRQLLGTRQAHLAGMSAEATEGVEPVFRDRGECFREQIPHPTDLAGGHPLPDDTGHHLRLSGLGELLQVREVHPLAAELDGMRAFASRCLVLAALEVYRGWVCDTLSGRANFPGRERGAGREHLRYLAGPGCRVGGSVVFE